MARVDKIQGAGNMVRAMLLKDWGLDLKQAEAWNKLINRFFKNDAPKAFESGDSALIIALSGKLVELTDAIPTSLIPRTTVLEGKLAELFPKIAPLGDSENPAVRAAVIRLAAKLRGKPDEVYPWLRKLYQSSDPTTRRGAR